MKKQNNNKKNQNPLCFLRIIELSYAVLCVGRWHETEPSASVTLPTTFSLISWILDFELILHLLQAVPVHSGPTVRSLLSCLQLIYFLFKALHVSRHNPCLVVSHSPSRDRLLSSFIRWLIDIWSLAIKNLLLCCFLSFFLSSKHHVPFKDRAFGRDCAKVEKIVRFSSLEGFDASQLKQQPSKIPG